MLNLRVPVPRARKPIKKKKPCNEPYEIIPPGELWRIELAKDLIAAKSGDVSLILDKDEIEEIEEELVELACSK